MSKASNVRSIYDRITRVAKERAQKIQIDDLLTIHTVVAWTTFIGLTVYSYLEDMSYFTWEEKLSFTRLSRGIPNYASHYFGLLLSTTKWGGRHYIITSILLLPSLLVAPVFIVYGYFRLLVFCVAAWSYWVVIKKMRLK